MPTNKKKPASIFIRTNSCLHKIRTDEIYYIKALDNYVDVFTKTESFKVKSTLKGMLDKLPGDDFVQIHRSYVVHIDRISQIRLNMLLVEKKKVLPVSNTYWKDLLSRVTII